VGPNWDGTPYASSSLRRVLRGAGLSPITEDPSELDRIEVVLCLVKDLKAGRDAG
jgi:hypothetical protein